MMIMSNFVKGVSGTVDLEKKEVGNSNSFLPSRFADTVKEGKGREG